MLSASIAKMSPSDATDEVKKTAMNEVHKVVGGQVKDILNDRNCDLDQYEQAIVFIGDAANPNEPDTKRLTPLPNVKMRANEFVHRVRSCIVHSDE